MSYTNDLGATNLSSVIGAAIGGLGASIVVISCFRYDKLSRTLSRRLICAQSIAHLMETLSILFLPSTNRTTCIIQGVVEEYAVYAGLFWGCAITYVLVLITEGSAGMATRIRSQNYLAYANVCCWLFPIPLALVPLSTGIVYLTLSFSIQLSTDDYARDAGGWCWFTEETISGRYYRLFHYLIVLACVFFITLASFKLYSQVPLFQSLLSLHVNLSSFLSLSHLISHPTIHSFHNPFLSSSPPIKISPLLSEEESDAADPIHMPPSSSPPSDIHPMQRMTGVGSSSLSSLPFSPPTVPLSYQCLSYLCTCKFCTSAERSGSTASNTSSLYTTVGRAFSRVSVFRGDLSGSETNKALTRRLIYFPIALVVSLRRKIRENHVHTK
jgi:hypothetical protein